MSEYTRPIVLDRAVDKRPRNGPVRVIVQGPVTPRTIGVVITQLTERQHVRDIDRDTRHMRGFNEFMRGARR